MKPLVEVILQVVERKQPRNVRELVESVREQLSSATVAEITTEIKNLQQEGLIALEAPTTETTGRIRSFTLSKQNAWFWTAIGLTLLAFVSILFVPATGTPLSYLRYFFGFVFVVFLPGYCLTETLFPRKHALDEIERATLAVGLSFAVTALVGLFLSFTPFRLTLTTALLTLGLIVFLLAFVALFRKSRIKD